MKHIKRFVKTTGLSYNESGEIGFGRKCVGIMNQKTESYLAYTHYLNEDYSNPIGHEVAENTMPKNAYHKGPYLAVLHDGSEKGHREAVKQLDLWLEKILAASFDLTEYNETNSFASMLNGGRVKQLCITGGISFGKFTEIF